MLSGKTNAAWLEIHGLVTLSNPLPHNWSAGLTGGAEPRNYCNIRVPSTLIGGLGANRMALKIGEQVTTNPQRDDIARAINSGHVTQPGA